ncbi:MAG: Fe-S cluster assembly protein SufD [Kangiellaceae bacterium]|nr:Fe-S cluster assembly protein SufD [Kangiellaceae bacterium]MCW8999684.1 Fe-S cluster assembly protein SufD [Kangiellaceae bacterium]MCW9016277.1 Fe-S cluster assembly protein SufD [Kangiellaceae bacterium]
MSNSIDFNNHASLDFDELSQVNRLEWLSSIQNDALGAFKSMPLPTRKVEHWKYNDMSFLKAQTFKLNTNTYEDLAVSSSQIALPNSIEITFINGVLISDLTTRSLQPGIAITSFDSVSTEQQQFIIEQTEIDSKNALDNLNLALCNNGILIEITKNIRIESPVFIRHITLDNGAAEVTTNRVLVKQQPGSEFTLVELFDSQIEEDSTLTLQQSLFSIDANATCNHYRLNLESERAIQSSKVESRLAQSATLNCFFLGLGSRLNRTDINVKHQGNGSHAELTGIYLPANEQAIDYHSNIEHQVAHCTSNEIFRGIIADEASATFNGKIHIFEDAQKSDAFLNNKNLLLTNRAEINTKPELEIYADDVKCAHGATVAQLDEKSVYYLQTRGIDRQKAKKMLSIAFIQELLNKVKLEELNDFLTSLLDEYMSHLD